MANLDTISRTSVVGSGYMGGGIAHVLALAGYPVALADVDAATAEKSRDRLITQAAQYESLGLFPADAAAAIADKLSAAPSIEHAVSDADYITEAVPEIVDVKLETLRRISGSARPEAIIGTNTSAIPIDELAKEVHEPSRFLGVHWMNPATFIPGVELIASTYTDAETVDVAELFVRSLGKITARVADAPGFVANRLQFALYKEALAIVEEGTATPEQVDAVVSNTFGFRLALFGPFAIGDMAGLDVYKGAYETLEQAFGERFAVPEVLTTLVEQGRLGVKSGRGLLDIAESDKDALLAYRDNAYGRLSALRADLGPAPGL
ncbi:3-hydroxyacyl-CoA dehydrogenase family protein [Rhodococcus wratislaviensis]|uniref:L-gulonate 3-dehydrogenase n=1 Tax=Rhodococcus wratislaviensis NBRC 100605 TaxID=1219028 RepID=X0PQZ6_RHOWR|nr:3-hydroxyacyl-CoA dehydrogenase family protein [Rhodococcus wratislaviensis]GAF45284.1 putative 3-hydroxyacyl-CoA dehydrogenase [Rhodococcus wratislaviensis NBRC 100605]